MNIKIKKINITAQQNIHSNHQHLFIQKYFTQLKGEKTYPNYSQS